LRRGIDGRVLPWEEGREENYNFRGIFILPYYFYYIALQNATSNGNYYKLFDNHSHSTHRKPEF
jgi:hypothetical protein